MIIRVVDKNDHDTHLIDATWIRWEWNKEAVSIAVYTHVSRTRGNCTRPEIEVAVVPSIYVHLTTGDTVYIMNNDGKVVHTKQMVVGTEDRKAHRQAVAESMGMRNYEREHNPDHQ